MLRYPDIFIEMEAIKKTKVPIIKFTEKEFGIKFDLSFN
jgi:DNA polymerase sigma